MRMNRTTTHYTDATSCYLIRFLKNFSAVPASSRVNPLLPGIAQV